MLYSMEDNEIQVHRHQLHDQRAITQIEETTLSETAIIKSISDNVCMYINMCVCVCIYVFSFPSGNSYPSEAGTLHIKQTK